MNLQQLLMYNELLPTGLVRGSTFDDSTTASGQSAASTPGIATPGRGGLGQMFKVTDPTTGRTVTLPKIDVGPAGWTGRGVDISPGGAKALGLPSDAAGFPTDRQFNVEPVAPGGVAQYNAGLKTGGPMTPTGLLVHHTGGAETQASDVANVLRQRGLSVQFTIDRNGGISQLSPDDRVAYHAGSLENSPKVAGRQLGNNNLVGVEVMARDEGDVNPAQRAAVQQLYQQQSQKWGWQPGSIWGHGELTGRKEGDEGATAAMIRGGTDLSAGLPPTAALAPVNSAANLIPDQSNIAATTPGQSAIAPSLSNMLIGGATKLENQPQLGGLGSLAGLPGILSGQSGQASNQESQPQPPQIPPPFVPGGMGRAILQQQLARFLQPPTPGGVG